MLSFALHVIVPKMRRKVHRNIEKSQPDYKNISHKGVGGVRFTRGDKRKVDNSIEIMIMRRKKDNASIRYARDDSAIAMGVLICYHNGGVS